MQVITHQFITFGCDHGDLECVGRLVFINLAEGFALWHDVVSEKVSLDNEAILLFLELRHVLCLSANSDKRTLKIKSIPAYLM